MASRWPRGYGGNYLGAGRTTLGRTSWSASVSPARSKTFASGDDALPSEITDWRGREVDTSHPDGSVWPTTKVQRGRRNRRGGFSQGSRRDSPKWCPGQHGLNDSLGGVAADLHARACSLYRKRCGQPRRQQLLINDTDSANMASAHLAITPFYAAEDHLTFANHWASPACGTRTPSHSPSAAAPRWRATRWRCAR